MNCSNPVCPVKFNTEKEPCKSCGFNFDNKEKGDLFDMLNNTIKGGNNG